jgi:hypothetical protein
MTYFVTASILNDCLNLGKNSQSWASIIAQNDRGQKILNGITFKNLTFKTLLKR